MALRATAPRRLSVAPNSDSFQSNTTPQIPANGTVRRSRPSLDWTQRTSLFAQLNLPEAPPLARRQRASRAPADIPIFEDEAGQTEQMTTATAAEPKAPRVRARRLSAMPLVAPRSAQRLEPRGLDGVDEMNGSKLPSQNAPTQAAVDSKAPGSIARPRMPAITEGRTLAQLQAESTAPTPAAESNIRLRPRKLARTSLLAAPRRGPLLPSMRPVQETQEVEDRDGCRTGKENVAPGDVVTFDIDQVKHAPKPRRTSLAPRRSSAIFGHELSRNQPLASLKIAKESDLRTPTVFEPSAKGDIKRRPTSPRQSSPKMPRISSDASIRKHTPAEDALANTTALTSCGSEQPWVAAQESALTELVNEIFAVRSPAPASPPHAKLRKALEQHRESRPFARIRQRVSASLQFGTLSLAPNTDGTVEAQRLASDVGRRTRFIRIIASSYTRPFLRAALEAVTGGVVPSTTYSPTTKTTKTIPSTREMTMFLEHHLLRNSDSAPPITSDREGWQWRRTLQRTIELIALLDAAKEDLCLPSALFRNTSQHTCTTDILADLLGVLHPLGRAALKSLAHLGVRPTHVQPPLAHYSYKITNLAIDLRDGVRIARLAELLGAPARSREMLGAESDSRRRTSAESLRSAPGSPTKGRTEGFVTQHLHYPAEGRAAMLANNELALRALRAHGGTAASVTNGIVASDLVDGHHEKTIALLWALVGTAGIDKVLDWDDVEGEIARLEKRAGFVNVLERECGDTTESAQCHALLHRWADAAAPPRHESRNHNIDAARKMELLLDEYAPLISSGAEVLAGADLAAKLRDIGCGPTFATLFNPATTEATSDPTSQPGPTLAYLFLASRLLLASRPERARRATLARLAADCAVIVRTRTRLEAAATLLQRTWRAGASARLRRKQHLTVQKEAREKQRFEDERLELDFWMV